MTYIKLILRSGFYYYHSLYSY